MSQIVSLTYRIIVETLIRVLILILLDIDISAHCETKLNQIKAIIKGIHNVFCSTTHTCSIVDRSIRSFDQKQRDQMNNYELNNSMKLKSENCLWRQDYIFADWRLEQQKTSIDDRWLSVKRIDGLAGNRMKGCSTIWGIIQFADRKTKTGTCRVYKFRFLSRAINDC